jgi:L-seryl-tRNA(Ser) seleniumtransferase
MLPDIARRLKQLPSVDELLRQCRSLTAQFGHELTTTELNNQLSRMRADIISGNSMPASRESISESICEQTAHALQSLFTPSLRAVFNLTGIVLHTNLGRAPYPQAAIDAMISISRGACNLEYNLQNGKRGRRDDHVERWICTLTGAEAATTVNNNAAAVMLVLNTLAPKKEVLVSRGELIEIGGSFRMPTIMEKSGCKLREVGTTNRTHLVDYESAIGKRTAAIMKVHTSNYEITGFGKSVSASELAPLTQQKSLPLIDDMGSGNLVDLTTLGLPKERTAAQAIAEGVDVITFSGDKLLGGPQCGIIAGRRELIRQIERNPMKRALRLDKLTLAALESVLKLYATPERLCSEVPALRMLTRPVAQLREAATALHAFIDSNLSSIMHSDIVDCESQIGSGSLPTKTLPGTAVALTPTTGSLESLVRKFRELPCPVIGRIHDGKILLDVRTLEDEAGLRSTLSALSETMPNSSANT